MDQLEYKKYDKYSYIINNAWKVRLIYLFGVVSWFGVIYGYIQFTKLNHLYFFIFLPLIGYFTLYYLLSYTINLFYRKFNIEKHNLLTEKYWSQIESQPSVDIFLPVCGEDLTILKRTFFAVSKLKYTNVRVYVLDDKNDPDVKSLAEKNKFFYLSRPNKGHMKKAGNLKFGFDNSDGEFIVIFDADFAPLPEFIHELLPYMSDERNAIVQSPQYFQVDKDVHGRSAVEYGAGHVQEDFYRIIQVARDYFGGAICVGSNAIYRRSALNKVGGTAQIEHSEDVHTGFNLLLKGYRVKYIPLILAHGLCPSELNSYFHQQHRWCSGSMSLLMSKRFWLSNISFTQKLCFISGFLYYGSHILEFLLPLQAFMLIFFHFEYINLSNAIPFYPALIYSFLILPLFRKGRQRRGTYIARMTYKYSYSHAIITKLLRRNLGWKPTNAMKGSISNEFYILFKINAVYLLIYLILTCIAFLKHKEMIFDINYYSVLFWIFYNLIIYSLFLVHSYKYIERDKRVSYSKKSHFWFWKARNTGLYISLLVLVITLSLLLMFEDYILRIGLFSKLIS